MNKFRVSTSSVRSTAYHDYLLTTLPDGVLLNLGAGSGQSVESRVVINVDHVAPSAPSGYWLIADAISLPFREACFDGALLKDVIEHLEDPLQGLCEVHRVVRPKGALVLTVPRAVPRAVWDDPTHVRGFTAHAITTALAMCGWRASKPCRSGRLPGAGRLRLTPYLETILRIPLLGHRFGTNWLVRAERLP